MNANGTRLALAMGAMIVAIAAAQAPQQAIPDSSNTSDPVIEAARRAAADFGKSSPDYVVKRTTTRYQGERPDGPLCLGYVPDPKAARTPPVPFIKFRWSKLDVVSGNLTLDRGAEAYTDIAVNGKSAKKTPDGGIWTAGEFSSVLLEILDPKTATRFTNQRPDLVGNRPSVRYDYAVDAAHSTWRLEAERSFTTLRAPDKLVRYSPAYDGAIWIDRETGQVLRIEKAARGLLASFPLARIESATDYDLVPIGTEKYSLPTHSVTYTCPTCTYQCTRNDTVFEDYRKFEAKTNITFDGGAK